MRNKIQPATAAFISHLKYHRMCDDELKSIAIVDEWLGDRRKLLLWLDYRNSDTLHNNEANFELITSTIVPESEFMVKSSEKPENEK